jgi:uncharacterized repeat protein (TIGR01451 family)
MKVKFLSILLLVTILLVAPGESSGPAAVRAALLLPIGAPTLKWQHGGCYTSWCETGWYSSPAVADLDKDGTMEVIGSAYSIFVLNGVTGALEWQVASGHDRSQPGAGNVGRTWPGIVVADVDRDGEREIVTAHSGGYVSVYDHNGYFKPGWPKHPTGNELRGLSVYDLDGDGTLEIVVTGALGSAVNTWVYEHDGTLRTGWPQLNNDSGYAWGVYNSNAAVGDLDHDGAGEIVVPSDVHYICAYEANGAQIPANAMYGGKGWGKVGVWESLATELRGWGECDGVRAESYRTNFADGPAVLADVNGDGATEVVVTGNVYDCDAGYPPSRYTGVYIFNADRSRFNAGGFDWNAPPVNTGAPISEDYNVIESAEANPAVADIDGDGNKEILFAAYDGRLHAYWLNKSGWTYAVYTGGAVRRFASEPAVADLNGDGYGEVVFASWTQKGSHQTGKLHILDYLGNKLQEVDLPADFGGSGSNYNGALAAPTLADIDGDSYLEVVLNTVNSGLVAYDLPGTVANARILWGTGRGNYWRNGMAAQSASLRKQVSRVTADFGNTLAYTLTLIGSGAPITLTDAIPAGAAYVPGSASSQPRFGAVLSGTTGITWTGTLTAAEALQVTFALTVTASGPQAIVNRARLDDGQGMLERTATTIANGLEVYLPVIRK